MWVHHGVHVHVHFAPPLRAPGLPRFVASGEVGSGTLSNPVVPEAAAAALRDA
jgi:UDPglucose--hexose-1-phosphate uridylyltransferase